LKHLRALREIARTGSFWEASQELNASLSTVSDHLAGLEALVGQRLIERSRGRRSVELTEAGRLLIGHANAIESRLRAAEADFRAYAAGTTGTLRVGIYQSVANKILPELMRRFKERWPDVDVQVTEGTRDDELVEAVERGELDLTFAIEPIPDGPLEVQQLMRDSFVLVVQAGSALGRERRSVRDLDGLPMVAYPLGKHQDSAEEFLRGRGVRPNVVFRSYDNGTLQAMVAAGLGFAIPPLLAVDEEEPATRVTALVEAVPPRVLVVVWHRDRYRPPSAASFVDTAVAVASGIERAQSVYLGRLISSAGGRRRAPARRPRRSGSRSR
jgi:molybdate transport repressor ModE-like protein